MRVLALVLSASAASACNGVPRELLVLGKACGPDGACLEGYVCEPARNECVPAHLLGVGATAEASTGTGGAGGEGGDPGGAGGGRAALGTPCDAGAECASSECADGVCCDSPCAGPCERCAGTAQGDGSCGPIDAGEDPDDECNWPMVCDGAGS